MIIDVLEQIVQLCCQYSHNITQVGDKKKNMEHHNETFDKIFIIDDKFYDKFYDLDLL